MLLCCAQEQDEFELSRLTGIKTYELHNIHIQNCILAAKAVIKMGVNKWVIAHYPQGAIAVSGTGEQILQKAINLTKDQIKGTVGAGDAFAAGVLLGLHKDWGVGKSIEMGMASACASLQHVTSSEGIINYRECLSMINYYGFKNESQITGGIT